eukprot:1543358-Pleurochrysis_carterae.AAC.8
MGWPARPTYPMPCRAQHISASSAQLMCMHAPDGCRVLRTLPIQYRCLQAVLLTGTSTENFKTGKPLRGSNCIPPECKLVFHQIRATRSAELGRPLGGLGSPGSGDCVPCCGPALHQILFQPHDRFRRTFFVAFPAAPFCHFGCPPLDLLLPAPVARFFCLLFLVFRRNVITIIYIRQAYDDYPMRNQAKQSAVISLRELLQRRRGKP